MLTSANVYSCGLCLRDRAKPDKDCKPHSDGLSKKRAEKVGPLLAAAHPGPGERGGTWLGFDKVTIKATLCQLPFGQPSPRKFENQI